MVDNKKVCDAIRRGRGGEYGWRGDYHKKLDPDWWYARVYRRKWAVIERIIENIPEGALVLDAGCGEGVLVERLTECGIAAIGVDRHYRSPGILCADVRLLPFAEGVFDFVFCLDVLEHLCLGDQPLAVREIARVLKPGGQCVFGFPNLAHLWSRFSFFMRGTLARTSGAEKHPGDRPLSEYLELCKACQLLPVKKTGIFLTLPVLYGFVTRYPRKAGFLFRLCSVFEPASLSFETIVIGQKRR